ncbi:MAG: M56 family metallopeptidase, partial [Saprospiraceae bacterium]
MLSIPQYLLESSFCLAIFYGFYHLFLKKETFFQLNRAYLLATPIAALSIPLLNISFQKDAPPESLEAFFYPAIQSANNLNEVVWEQMRAPSPVFSLSVADIIMAIYLIGIFLMSFSLLKGLWNLGRIIRRGKRSKNNEFTLVETQNNFPAASFFGYIFWNQQITDEQKLILEHEKVHIRQWHSLDVLLMEVCVILKWFNPLIYWFRNALKATHEFIADQYVIQQKSNVSDYATLLVNQHKQQVAAPLTNTFSALTKKRLHKMIQRPSRKVWAVKYILILPLLMGLMSLFSFNLLEEIPQVSEGLAEMNSVLEDIGDKTVFEIDKPFLTDESTVLSQAENRISTYKIHLGDLKYNAGNATKFNSLDHKNDLNLKEIQTLLDNAILFTKEGEKLDLYKINLVIPNPNVKYRTTNNSVKVGTEGEMDAFVIEATKTEDFKFNKSAVNSFLKRIHNGSIFFIYGYSKSGVFISEFLVDYATGEISNKEMDRFFYFPKNPNHNKLKSGQEEISVALNMLKLGAYDYIIKDDNTKELL